MVDQQTKDRIRQNWQSVVRDVHAATDAASRPADSVHVVGVSKYVDAETTLALAQAGCHALGENRPQLLWQKNEAVTFPADVRWHLIGHLQRNKIRRSLPLSPLIHSVDSDRLMTAIADESILQRRTTTVLVEVNISGEKAKTGLSPEAVEHLLTHLPSEGVNVVGLMAMAGWGTDQQDARAQFAQTRSLRDDLQQRLGISLPELSMGMSGDFAAAIAEGATMVRIGSRLFEGVR
ncbi:Pyridoxal phosphate homeostasis protein [Planctomycetes bacterium CA13]|uniref:Pyridoxal phosphate homeostasis protein n=1 Tax=Novipirellula herctigrandis TaxID=2527986 RepID=A0A5C5YX28_9BACT|nr:Pyridoxal phosphate homeostasis protein [Planctomycetes bacterium CA13]